MVLTPSFRTVLPAISPWCWRIRWQRIPKVCANVSDYLTVLLRKWTKEFLLQSPGGILAYLQKPEKKIDVPGTRRGGGSEQILLGRRLRKSIRNAISKSKIEALRYFSFSSDKRWTASKIKSVSDDWLVDTCRSEIIFSQGMFEWEELKQQTLITVEIRKKRLLLS